MTISTGINTVTAVKSNGICSAFTEGVAEAGGRVNRKAGSYNEDGAGVTERIDCPKRLVFL